MNPDALQRTFTAWSPNLRLHVCALLDQLEGLECRTVRSAGCFGEYKRVGDWTGNQAGCVAGCCSGDPQDFTVREEDPLHVCSLSCA